MTNAVLDQQESSLALLTKQRSHLLFVLSEPKTGSNSSFLAWYKGDYRDELLKNSGVLTVRHYERHEVDITLGAFPPIPFQYLSICELSFDGAEATEGLLDRISVLHRDCNLAAAPATWLYYPMSEKVGRSPASLPCMLTMAFANPADHKEAEFREWYATRHIRHALNVPALVSGQCFERTQFQRPGALEASFAMIAMYEQLGPPKAVIDGIAAHPPETFRFPALHPSKFAEWVYRPL